MGARPYPRTIGYMLDTPLGIPWPDDGIWYWTPRAGLAHGWPAMSVMDAASVYILLKHNRPGHG